MSAFSPHVFIDEFQDLAGYDWELVECFLKSSCHVVAVGDPHLAQRLQQGRRSGQAVEKPPRRRFLSIAAISSKRCFRLLLEMCPLFWWISTSRSASRRSGKSTTSFARAAIKLRWSGCLSSNGLCSLLTPVLGRTRVAHRAATSSQNHPRFFANRCNKSGSVSQLHTPFPVCLGSDKQWGIHGQDSKRVM